MAVGPATLPDFYSVSGLKVGTASAGIKKPGRKDVVVFEFAPGSRVAGVFTQNAFCAAPVHLAKRHLQSGNPSYWLINTGNANAGTGKQGMKDALACCEALASLTGSSVESVLPFSTGVIGEPLPTDKIIAALPAALEDLSETGWARAAEGIMTTDTRPKGASRKLTVGGNDVVISGISKGAGMIRPNMATMLGFIATDLAIEPSLLQEWATHLSERSFNRITVDGDTSTNDACMIVATGKASAPELTRASPELAEVRRAFEDVYVELAQAIVRDGEGATKLVTIEVNGANTSDEALDVAFTIAHSPLVKTALFAADPNWGRILAAVGRAGVSDLDLDAIEIYLGEVCIVRGGGRADSYTEEQGQAAMDGEEITIRVELNRGDQSETVWTCDFSHEYVTINAEYRT